MKIIGAMAAGLALLLAAGGAQAGAMDVVYWGEGAMTAVVVDGYSYDVSGDYAAVSGIGAGDHSITITANGQTFSADFTLTGDNQVEDGRWCFGAYDEGWNILNAEECDDALAYLWLFGDDDQSGPP